MNRMDVNQGGRGKNKRFWTKEEELALINGLLELSVDPVWKAEGSFKSGFMNKLEQILSEKVPGCGLKATPHIESKIKWFRDKYNILAEMLRTSGFGWDDSTQMLQCERQAYDDFCKTHKAAKGLWKTFFPFFEQLEQVYGADRANGSASETFVQAVENQQNVAIDLGDDQDIDTLDEFGEDESVQSTRQTPLPPHSKKANKETTPKGRGKKRRLEIVDLSSSFNTLSSNFTGVMIDMTTQLSSIASSMSTTQQHEQALMAREEESERKRKGLVTELLCIPGITRPQAVVVARKLAADPTSLDLFYDSQDDDFKKDFVLSFISPNVHQDG